jgi:hypothetical protein
MNEKISLDINDESVDVEFQKLILKFYPDAKLDETDVFLMDRYEDVKNMIIDLLNDMITEDSSDEI